MKYRLLLLGDIEVLGNELRTKLQKDCEFLKLKDVRTFPDLVLNWLPDLVLFALNSAEQHDFGTFLHALQKKKGRNFGIVCISSEYSLKHEAAFFKAGGDHFLLKNTPLESIELRIQSLLNRSMNFSINSSVATSNKLFDDSNLLPLAPKQHRYLSYESLELWPDKHLCNVDGKEVHLSPTHYKICLFILSRPEELLSREKIKQYVWGAKAISLRSIDAHITKLKKQLPILTDTLVNVYGKGYRLKGKVRSAA